MKYSFIVINLNDSITQKEITDYFKSNYPINSYEIIYCTSKKATKSASLKNYIFNKNENSESILNAVIMFCNGENICIIRNVTGYNLTKQLTDKLTQETQIVYYKKNLSGFKLFWHNVLKKITGFMFLQNLQPINYGVTVYGKSPSTILKKLKSPAILLKANNWEGIKMDFVDGGIPNKFGYKKTGKILTTVISAILAIAIFVLPIVLRLPNLAIVALYTLDFSLILICFVSIIKWVLSSMLGDNIKYSAKILNE